MRLLEIFDKKAQEIHDNTPPDRNRYADFLRTASIIVVVLGHWLLAYITVEDGQMQAERLLILVPETQWLTWIFQVMPLFFFVGGLANAIGWESAQKRGQGYVNWLRNRARRLLWPVVPLILFWIPVVLFLNYRGTPTDLVILATQVVLLPVRFLAAYLCVVTISPAALWLHKKAGIAALLGFVAMAIIVDILHRSGVPYIGWSNFVWVWGATHQAGFFWHDRAPRKPLSGILLALASYGFLVFLTQTLDYPLSMVGTGEAGRTNNSPPSTALVFLAFGQVGLVVAFHKQARRWLQKPRIWALVVTLGSKLMTVYIWHMTAMVAVAAAAYPTGLWPSPTQVDLAWWLSRIPWIFILTVTLLLLVAAFGRFERPRRGRPTSLSGWPARLKAILGVALTTAGLALLVAGGLVSERGPLNLPWIPLILLVLGLVALGVIGSSKLTRTKAKTR